MNRKPVILLVEDNEDDVFLIRSALDKAFIDNPVYAVSDGAQALAYLVGAGAFADRNTYPLPDVMLLDLVMPGLDGFGVLRWVRGQGLFSAINVDLAARGLLLREGTLVDATLIAAPPSTKNKERQRDPEMHQTRKGNQWYFGMKAHIGADRDSKLVHTVVVTAANVADITQTAELLHGEEKQVHAAAGYLGVEKRPEIVALERKIDWQIARKRGAIKTMAEGEEKTALKAAEKLKASVRAFVEHPFHILKNIFGHRKVRYRGLAKNGHQLYTLFGLANVLIGARQAKA